MMRSGTAACVRYGSRLVLAAAIVAGMSCGDSGGPDLSATPNFRVMLDGTPWIPDTVNGVLFGRAPDQGTLNLFAVRSLTGQGQTLAIVIRNFPPTGSMILGDTSAPATGVYAISYSAGPIPNPVNYLSIPGKPGHLRITGVNTTDSVVAGSFAFEAATSPDTGSHHTLSGSFVVRYSFQQVYTPIRIPPR